MSRRVKAWIGRRAFAHMQRKNFDLSRISFVPESALLPLQRNDVDPVPALAHTRAANPMAKLDLPFGPNAWLVTGYDEARTVLTDSRNYSTDIRHLFGQDGPATADDIGGLGFTDPPVHTRLRKMLTPEFTMRRLDRLKPRINEIINDRLDAVESAGQGADLASLFAFPIPFLTICELLGLPSEDQAAFQRLGSARFDVTNGAAGVFGAVSESREFLFEAVRKQRQEPGDGLIGHIIREVGDGISDHDLGGLADGVFTGGYETTAGLLTMGTYVLLKDPSHFALAREGDEGQVAALVEEMLRYLSVVQLAFPRFAKEDFNLFGHDVQAGDVVFVSLSGANRDPSLGADIERFDPFRPAKSAHLAFGHGIHRCIGVELARIELRAAYPALAKRFPNLALAVPPAELKFRKTSLVYGVEELPVTF